MTRDGLLEGGSLTIEWAGAGAASVDISGYRSGTATRGGSSASFPYDMSAETTWDFSENCVVTVVITYLSVELLNQDYRIHDSSETLIQPGIDFNITTLEKVLGAVLQEGGGSVGAETTRATAAETTLQGNINAKASTSALTAEVDRATAAEAAAQAAAIQRANHTGSQAQSTVTNLVSDLAAKATTTALTAETSRATAAETALSTDVGTRATSSALTTETSRATAAEVALQDLTNGTFAAGLDAAYVKPLGKTTITAAAPLPSFNVKDYGALGDNATDDSASIQAAIAAASAAGGGQVIFPDGTYRLLTGLTVKKEGVQLVGTSAFGDSGKAGCVISWQGTGFALTIGGASSGDMASGSLVENLSIIGGTSAWTAGRSGIRLTGYARRVTLRRVGLFYLDVAAHLGNAVTDDTNVVEGCNVRYINVGVLVQRAAHFTVIRGNRFVSYDTAGVQSLTADTAAIIALRVLHNEFTGVTSTGVAVWLTRADHFVIADNYIEGDTALLKLGVGSTTYARFGVISNNYMTITNAGYLAEMIAVDYATQLSFLNNWITQVSGTAVFSVTANTYQNMRFHGFRTGGFSALLSNDDTRFSEVRWSASTITAADEDFFVRAGVRSAVREETTSFTLTVADRTVVSNSSGSVTATLPNTTLCRDGREYTIKNRGTGTVTVSRGSGSGLIEGATTLSLAGTETVTLRLSGLNWLAVGRTQVSTTPTTNTAGVYKASNTTRNNTATKTADPDLTMAVLANGIYLVEAWLGYEATTTGDINISWSGPSGATMVWSGGAMTANATATTSATVRSRISLVNGVVTMGGVGAGVATEARPVGLLTVSSTAGTFALTWAQAVAEVSDAILYAGSWLKLTQIA